MESRGYQWLGVVSTLGVGGIGGWGFGRHMAREWGLTADEFLALEIAGPVLGIIVMLTLAHTLSKITR